MIDMLVLFIVVPLLLMLRRRTCWGVNLINRFYSWD